MRQAIVAAIGDGTQFLLAAQQPDGFWRDYDLPPGASSAWVTAFVGYALSGARCADAEALARAVGALRASCRPSGWGYNAAVATDADTSAWVVRWFAHTGTPQPLEPVACLERYLGPEGGARTFVCGARFGRWTLEHADVTAVLGLALVEAGAPDLAVARVRRWLLERRNGDGVWTSFWWTFDGYATARALELLAATGGIPADASRAARDFLVAAAAPATAMELANLLLIAHCARAQPEPWLTALLGRQQRDGGWPSSRVLRLPEQRAASESAPAFEDGHRLMSTAMSIMALTAMLDDR